MSEAIKIEKSIPLPPLGGRPSRYPWLDMKVGDSFAVPSGVKKSSFSRLAYMTSRNLQRRFTVRKVDGGYRCWRVA